MKKQNSTLSCLRQNPRNKIREDTILANEQNGKS